ncbi:MAG: hypothetical protein U0X39_02380 [Bacteroidales bacterium]
MPTKIIAFFILLQLSQFLSGQSDSLLSKRSISGFTRAGFYSYLRNLNEGEVFNSAFSDLGLKFDSNPVHGIIFSSDVRIRYGTEFSEEVSRLDVKEAYAGYSGKRLSVTAGQMIVKWGRADFTNPTSRFNPMNYLSRSPDKEDMDLGNVLFRIRWFPSPIFVLQSVISPYYRSSALFTNIIPVPDFVKIINPESHFLGSNMISYGLKADFHLKGIDMGIMFFDGFDPLPGLAMTGFSADFSGSIPVINAEMTFTPFRTRVTGFDFETSAGSLGIRGEAALSIPVLSANYHEYVPLKEAKFVLGFDYSPGNWRFTWEYSGSLMLDYFRSTVPPVIGTNPDYSQLAALLSTPGFDLAEYFRQQIGSFNRLYFNQLEKSYHNVSIKIERDISYGRIIPSITCLYNFTSTDLLIIPEIRIKAADGLSLVGGAEIYSGNKTSIYYIIKDFLTCAYVGIRADF